MKPVQLTEKDTAPSILTYRVAGVAVDITNYAFKIKIGYAEPLVKAAVLLDQVTDKGRFQFEWTADDLKEGEWPFEILTTFPGGTEKTSPQMQMNIAKRIA